MTLLTNMPIESVICKLMMQRMRWSDSTKMKLKMIGNLSRGIKKRRVRDQSRMIQVLKRSKTMVN